MKNLCNLGWGLVFLMCLCCASGVDSPPAYTIPVTYERDVGWSPDGSSIVYDKASYPSKNIIGGLTKINLQDSSSQIIMQGILFDSPRFSPDGCQIAFSNGENIFAITANGDSLRQLTFGSDNYQPTWSPDGKKIAYNHRQGDDRGIYILDLETGASRLLRRFCERPVWFSDGVHIATGSFDFEAAPEIMILDTSGNIVARPLEGRHGWAYYSEVSQDGQKIVFSQRFSGEHPQIWIVNRDGSGLKRLTSHGGEMPSISPDGQWIVYTHTGDTDGSLWLIRPDGTGQHRLTNYFGE